MNKFFQKAVLLMAMVSLILGQCPDNLENEIRAQCKYELDEIARCT